MRIVRTSIIVALLMTVALASMGQKRLWKRGAGTGSVTPPDTTVYAGLDTAGVTVYADVVTDGTTDNWTALSDAVASANTARKTLWLPSGTIHVHVPVNNPIHVEHNVRIMGPADRSAILSTGDTDYGTPFHRMFTIADGDTAIFENLEIAGTVKSPAYECDGIVIESNTNTLLTVNNVLFRHWTQGIHLMPSCSGKVYINHSVFTDTRMGIQGGAARLYIDSCTFYDIGRDESIQDHAIYTKSGAGLRLTNSTFRLGSGYGVHFFDDGTPQDIGAVSHYINNCTFDLLRVSIAAGETAGVIDTVSNCVIDSCKYGIQNSTGDILITGCTITTYNLAGSRQAITPVWFASGTLTGINNTINVNPNSDGGGGGYLTATATWNFTNCVWNDYESGGTALAYDAGSGTLTSCTFNGWANATAAWGASDITNNGCTFNP
jgi:hypothetical protein